MCRSIKVLRQPSVPATSAEVQAAALQFVRKVSGYHKPSKLNEVVFNTAVQEIAQATERLLDGLAKPHHVAKQAVETPEGASHFFSK